MRHCRRPWRAWEERGLLSHGSVCNASSTTCSLADQPTCRSQEEELAPERCLHRADKELHSGQSSDEHPWHRPRLYWTLPHIMTDTSAWLSCEMEIRNSDAKLGRQYTVML